MLRSRNVDAEKLKAEKTLQHRSVPSEQMHINTAQNSLTEYQKIKTQSIDWKVEKIQK